MFIKKICKDGVAIQIDLSVTNWFTEKKRLRANLRKIDLKSLTCLNTGVFSVALAVLIYRLAMLCFSVPSVAFVLILHLSFFLYHKQFGIEVLRWDSVYLGELIRNHLKQEKVESFIQNTVQYPQLSFDSSDFLRIINLLKESSKLFLKLCAPGLFVFLEYLGTVWVLILQAMV